jgi:pimeloyl-ACP methyl ester carboxylesterase
MLVLAMACSSGDIVVTDTGDTGDTPDTEIFGYRGTYFGSDFAEAVLEITQREDGGESLVGTSVLDFEGFWDMRLVVTEHVELDAAGRVETWTQEMRHTLGTSTVRYRFEVDAEERTALQGLDDHSATFGWTEQGPVVLYPYPSDGFFGIPLPSPLAGYVITRAFQQGEDLVVVLPYFHVTTVALTGSLPHEWQWFGDTYYTDADGFVDAYIPGAYGIEVSPADDVELDPVSVARPTTGVPAQMCPVPGPGMRHREFVTTSDDGTAVAGRLLLPGGSGPFPAVQINAGSGGANRRGFILPLSHWDCLAHGLLSEGIAVVSYDDRGWGASGGEINDSFTGRSEDAAAVATWVTDQVDIDGLYLLGHSEGAAHASEAAVLGPDPDGLILVAGVASTGAEVWVEQAEAYLDGLGFPRSQVRMLTASRHEIIAQVEAGTYAEVTLGGWPVDDFWAEFFAFDGTELARATEGPVLVVQGGADWQVPRHHGDDFLAALEADGREVTLEAFPGLGHLLQPVVGPASMGMEYHLPWSWDSEVVDAIADWVIDQEAPRTR